MSRDFDEVATGPTVWIIDSQHWPRAHLRAELIERGFDAVGYEELAPALAALHRLGSPKPRVIVLELCGLPPGQGELEALARTGIPIILLCSAVKLQAETIRASEWAAVIRRPFSIGAVVDVVERLVGSLRCTIR